jgi:signal transduction histidine kinase
MWFGFHAISEWRRISVQVADQRASQEADLLLEAITRDMSGVQMRVLASRHWNVFSSESPYAMTSVVAGAFARYRYPESFFAWRGEPHSFVFFNRSDRRPAWLLQPPIEAPEFPVVIADAPAWAAKLRAHVRHNAAQSREFFVTELTFDGTEYQVVAQLTYQDTLRSDLLDAVGFIVNLNWVRAEYFSQLVGEIEKISGGQDSGLRLTISGPDQRYVVGSQDDESVPPTSYREFPLLFYDPLVVDFDATDHPQTGNWQIAVNGANNAALLQTLEGANRTFAAYAVSMLTLAVGLLLAGRAERTRAALNQLRADFVSTVTHELKTPVTAIRAAAQTLTGGHLKEISDYQVYARHVLGQAHRLSRLIENLLAYSRVTDVADVYSFEAIDLIEFFERVRHEFRVQFTETNCVWAVSIADGIPPIRGDKFALRLLFDNLIDNALRYSTDQCAVNIAAHQTADRVIVEVRDRGVGIPQDELEHVTHKFVRGRTAMSGGSGLGLTIASRIARDHRGTLTIHSIVGEGTTVTVTLPLFLRPDS